MVRDQSSARRVVLVPSANPQERLRRYRLARLEDIAFQPPSARRVSKATALAERATASFGRSAVRTNG